MRFPYRVRDLLSVQKNFDFLSGTVTRTVVGRINTTTPSIEAGSGFTIVKNGTGDVTITFARPFTPYPCVKAMARGLSPIVEVREIAAPTPTTVQLGVYLWSSGAAVDGTFNFSAGQP